MRLLWNLAVGGALVYAGLGLYLYLFQSRYLYFPDLPSREIRELPSSAGLAYQPVTLATSDGEHLDGWYIPASDPSRGTVLYFHGNAGNIGDRLDPIALFHRLGLQVFIFDYRGYGKSSGHPSEEGTYRDAEAAWRYLVQTRRTPPGEIILFGESLGGAIAAWLAARTSPRALILTSVFTSVPDMARELYPFLPTRLLARFRYNTKESLAKVDCPVLVIHSPQDEMIPFAHGQALHAAAGRHGQFLEIRGGHNDGFYLSEDIYERGINAFLRQLEQKKTRPGVAPHPGPALP